MLLMAFRYASICLGEIGLINGSAPATNRAIVSLLSLLIISFLVWLMVLVFVLVFFFILFLKGMQRVWIPYGYPLLNAGFYNGISQPLSFSIFLWHSMAFSLKKIESAIPSIIFLAISFFLAGKR